MRTAAGFSFEDARIRRLGYHLPRLSVIQGGLTHVKDLGELGGLAFGESEVTGSSPGSGSDRTRVSLQQR